MTQPILIGLIGAICSLAVAVVTLIGVLVKTNADYKLGKRTGDIAAQSAEDTRAKQIADENRELRKEITLLWDTERDLRRQLTEKDEAIAHLNAEANTALRAQERAEGGLVVAQQALRDIASPTEIPPPPT